MSMNSFNNIVKVKYEKTQKDLVSLLEYIIFEDERNNEKFLVFKFQNNVNQYLNEIKFEISQYDEDNNLTSKSVISHGGFLAKENEVFVPNYKLKADQDCVKIKAKLLLARYERMVWENGNYTPIPYTASEFRHDYYRPAPEKPLKNKKLIKAQQKVEYKQFKKLQKEFNKRSNISIKYIIKRNKTKGPLVLSIILSMITLAVTGALTFISSQDSNVYFDGTFDYTVEYNGVYITDYEGNDDHVILPTTYTINDEELLVVGIGKNAFANTNVSTIEITQNVSIGESAFENCDDLIGIVGSDKITSVGPYAFKDCTSLLSISLPNVNIVSVGAFEGCKNLNTAILPNAALDYSCFKGATSLKTLDCKMVNGNKALYTLFGDENEDLTQYSINTVKIGQSVIPADFTNGLKSISSIEFKEARPIIEFGALSGASIYDYINNDSVEILDGKIISVKDKANITLPRHIDIEDAFELLYTFANQVKTLTIEYNGYTTITKEHIKPLKNLTSLNISKHTRVTSDILNANPNITELGISLDSKYSVDITSNIKTLRIFETSIVTANMFNGLGNLKNINTLSLADSVSSYTGKAFAPFVNLKALTIPNYFHGNYQYNLYSDLGVSKSLNKLEIINLGSKSSLKLKIYDYDQLTLIDIEDLNITNLGLTVSECSSLRELNIPESVTLISNTLVEKCPITRLVVSSNVKTLTYPLIGAGCTNLKYVEVPFIGKSQSATCEYKKFNESYKYTTELVVSTQMTGNIDNMFADCSTLNKLEINVSELISLEQLFGTKEVHLESLVLSCPNINDAVFDGATINRLYIKEAFAVSLDAFININKLNTLYLPSKEVAEMVNYENIFKSTYPTIYVNGSMPENVDEYKSYFVTNAKLEDILRK